MTQPYPIGTPGTPWGPAERARWRAGQRVQRRVAEDVTPRIDALRDRFDVEEYGRVDTGADGAYPLLAIRSRGWDDALPVALVTGGVHGYETSGVHGALRFVEDHGADYAGRVNLLVAPCVSPSAYERIHRWNADANDPNRNFRAGRGVPDGVAATDAAGVGLVAGAGVPSVGGAFVSQAATTSRQSGVARCREPSIAASLTEPVAPGKPIKYARGDALRTPASSPPPRLLVSALRHRKLQHRTTPQPASRRQLRGEVRRGALRLLAADGEGLRRQRLRRAPRYGDTRAQRAHRAPDRARALAGHRALQESERALYRGATGAGAGSGADGSASTAA